jgi:hypothetical protein
MRREGLKIPIAVAFAIALLLAGCGGGGSGSGSSELSKAEFIEQADAICTKADKTQSAALAKATKEVTGNVSSVANQKHLVVSAGLPPVQQEAEEIAGLGAPKSDEGEINAFVEAIEGGVEESEKDPSKLEPAFAEANELGAKYGFKACAEPL